MVSGTTISHCHKAGHELSGALIAAMAAVHDFAVAQPLDTGMVQRLAIVVEEVVTNLLEHAAHGRDITFALALDRGEDRPRVTLEDDSDPFDPRSAPVPETPDPIRGGGVGLALVNAWTDIVSYDSHGGWNRLILKLRRPADRAG